MPVDSLLDRDRPAAICVPDDAPLDRALHRITHLGIGAHPDDLEIMAYHGIAACFGEEALWFGGVTCSDGAGSPRGGSFAAHSDERMREVRRREQEQAAHLGAYGVMVQLGYPSATIHGAGRTELEQDLLTLLARTEPTIVYTHNLADKHETHVAVALATLRAIRRLPTPSRPQAVYGCEAWRDLDWMPDDEVVALDVSRRPELAEQLVAVFRSQISAGKRYDLAAAGRRRANATFRSSHEVDRVEQAWLAMDLTPLIVDDAPDSESWVRTRIERFAADVRERLLRNG